MAEKDYAYWERLMPELRPERVAERLEALREARRIANKADFARSIGVLPTEYSNWLSGKARLTIHKAAAIARAHRVTLDYLILGELSGIANPMHDDILARLNVGARKNSRRKS